MSVGRAGGLARLTGRGLIGCCGREIGWLSAKNRPLRQSEAAGLSSLVGDVLIVPSSGWSPRWADVIRFGNVPILRLVGLHCSAFAIERRAADRGRQPRGSRGCRGSRRASCMPRRHGADARESSGPCLRGPRSIPGWVGACKRWRGVCSPCDGSGHARWSW